MDSRPLGAVDASDRGAAFLRLADGHLDAAYRLARAILRDSGEAQDATHDAIVQAWRKWSTLRDQDRFVQWFDRILVNICRNRLHQTSRWQAKDISTEVATGMGDPFGNVLDRDILGTAITTLSPDYRALLWGVRCSGRPMVGRSST